MEQMRREIAACLRASRRRAHLPHTASLICPIVQNEGVRSPTQEDSR
jgi:hypothetical protein